tara:strand:- start:21 stop:986 length:966 start_codon:yes stop_codon:yes gene_type:complete
MNNKQKGINEFRNELLSTYEKGTFSLPRVVLIETRSKCNGTCAFCPASALTDERSDELMSLEVFNKIIDDLAKINYSNRVSLFNNNEPFLDKRIFEIVALTRKALPRAFIELKSNGTLLNEKKVIKIFEAGLDMLNINDYTKDFKHTKNIEILKKELSSSRRFNINNDIGAPKRINIELRKMDAVLSSRGGKSPNKKDFYNPYKNQPCMRAAEMLTINPRGNVGVCCEDYASTLIVGNVNKESIYKIWTSKNYVSIRKSLLKGNRSINHICSKCDHIGYSNEMLDENNVKKPGVFNKLFIKKLTGKLHKIWKTKSLGAKLY